MQFNVCGWTCLMGGRQQLQGSDERGERNLGASDRGSDKSQRLLFQLNRWSPFY